LLNNFGYALFLLKDYDHATTILSQAVALDGQCAEYAPTWATRTSIWGGTIGQGDL